MGGSWLQGEKVAPPERGRGEAEKGKLREAGAGGEGPEQVASKTREHQAFSDLFLQMLSLASLRLGEEEVPEHPVGTMMGLERWLVNEALARQP